MAAVVDSATMKAQVREAVAGRQTYNVANFYSEAGPWQFLARNPQLDNIMCAVIVLYAVWAAVDIDHNEKANLLDRDPVFMIISIAFAIIFWLEVFIRFMAFKRKRDCCKDVALLGDAVLASVVILDVWVPILRFFQIFARMYRLWRKLPEMLIILKGLFTASRSVFWFLLLELFLTYLFSLALCTLLRGTPVGEIYFPTVKDSMHGILIHGIIFGAHADLLHELNQESPIAEVFFVIFMFLTWTTFALTFGCLCETVSVVAAVEKEVLVISYAKERLIGEFEKLDSDGTISKQAFQQMLLSPSCARMIQELGVDIIGLVDILDDLFSDDDDEVNLTNMTVEQLTEMILQLRGCNSATVKDMVDLRKFMCKTTQDSTDKIEKAVAKPLSDRLGKVEELLNQFLDKKESKGFCL